MKEEQEGERPGEAFASFIPNTFLAEPSVADDPRVEQLLAEIGESDCTPEEVCRACPELLPEVRRRWLLMRILDAELDALFPAEPSSISEGGSARGVPGPAANEARNLAGFNTQLVPTADASDE